MFLPFPQGQKKPIYDGEIIEEKLSPSETMDWDKQRSTSQLQFPFLSLGAKSCLYVQNNENNKNYFSSENNPIVVWKCTAENNEPWTQPNSIR